MGGRPRKPTAVKKLTGTLQKCRTNHDEPKLDVIVGAECPDVLVGDKRGEETWKWSVEMLTTMRVLTAVDLLALEKFCLIDSEVIKLSQDIRKEGHVFTYLQMDSMGNEIPFAKPNPKVTMRDRAMDAWRRYAVEFGFTPSSRSKIKANLEEKKDPLDELDDR